MIRSRLCLASEFLIKAEVVKFTLECHLFVCSRRPRWEFVWQLISRESFQFILAEKEKKKSVLWSENKQEQNRKQEEELLAAEGPKWRKTSAAATNQAANQTDASVLFS